MKPGHSVDNQEVNKHEKVSDKLWTANNTMGKIGLG